MKKFLIKYEVLDGNRHYPYYIIDDYENYEDALKKTEVIHDICDLDKSNTPIGGAEGECHTEVMDIKEISPEDYNIIRKYFCIG